MGARYDRAPVRSKRSNVVNSLWAAADLPTGSGASGGPWRRSVGSMGHLVELAPDVYAWLQEPPGHDLTNAGVVVAPDGITVVDTLLVPSQAAELEAAVAR